MAAVSDERLVNTIRIIAAEMPSAAKSGHPGAPIGCAPMAYVLWMRHMNYNPAHSSWANRDRFVLSNGHACALQYTMLHLTGYNLSLDELKRFRKLGSKTPGHPEVHHTDGIEVTTGPLGQGFANAVGLAIAQEHIAATFNKPGHTIIDNYTYVIMGDGCNQEGVTSEAASLAGHLGLGRLIVLYDDNQITIDGPTSHSFTEDVNRRFEAYGWHVQTVGNGDTDINSIDDAIKAAKAVTDKPSFIKVRTTIGLGSKEQGTGEVHGTPLKADDLKHVKSHFGFDPEKSFDIPAECLAAFRNQVTIGTAKEAEWNTRFAAYKAAFPALAAEFERRMSNGLPENWKAALPRFTAADKPASTRKLHGLALNALAPVLPELMGGSADLTPSNNTWISSSHDFQIATRDGRYLRFGVREHGMAAVMNGMTAYGGLIPFGATFLNFIGYALGAVRLSAISGFRVLYIMTHDSIGLGEDGPTHQPIESLASCRAMPNLLVLRPADGNEVSGAYTAAIENVHRPTVMALTRQDLPQIEGTSIEGFLRGGYVVSGPADPQLILVGTGSELSLCVDAAKQLADVKVRVVSLPSWELFEEQSVDYRASVLLDGVPTLSVEAAAVTGWHKYAHAHHGMTTFGASGPAADVAAHFGFVPAKIAEKSRALIAHFAGKQAPVLVSRLPF